jgi:hypothetical protein
MKICLCKHIITKDLNNSICHQNIGRLEARIGREGEDEHTIETNNAMSTC